MPAALRLAGLPCLLVLCLAADAPGPHPDIPQAQPATMQGFLRHKVRGLSAVQGGILSGVFMMAATGTGMHSAAANTLRLMLGGVAQLSDNPGMKEMNDFLRTGKGFDFSGVPVSAGYDVELDFVLESDGKGGWRLKTGNARFSGNTDSDVALSSPDGNNHRFTDRYRSMGTARLTPQNASITLTTTGKGKDQRAHFDVSVSFPVTLVGKSTWSAMGGLAVITLEDNGGVSKSGMTFLGQQYGDQTEQTRSYAGVQYGRSGPLDSVLRGRETWQNLADAGEMVEWELWDRCSARIETPDYYDELTFDESTTGRILRPVKADVQPSFWDQDLHWKFMPMSGSDIDPTPDRANGNDFDLAYTKLPPKNSSFGHWLLRAEFATDRARKAGCKNPEPHEISYHYSREANNNPGPRAREAGSTDYGPDPNWFFYWRQTKAAVGRADATRYGGRTAGSCVNPGVGGYYSLGSSHIVVCDLAPGWHFTFSHPYADYLTDGIDTFAAVVLHEWKHHDDFKQWWPKGRDFALDKDDDRIPDRLEPTVPVPPPLNGRHKFFDPDMKDTLGRGVEDEHYLAWMAMIEWPVGSADHEDWACPGHQASDACAAR